MDKISPMRKVRLVSGFTLTHGRFVLIIFTYITKTDQQVILNKH